MNKKQFLFLGSLMLVSPFLKASCEIPKVENQFDVVEHAIGFATALGATALLMVCIYNIIAKKNASIGVETRYRIKDLVGSGAFLACLTSAGMLGAEKLLSGAEPGVKKTAGKFAGGCLPVFILLKVMKHSTVNATNYAAVTTVFSQFSNWAGRRVYRSLKSK